MEKNLKITILTDKTSWMNEYNEILKTKLEKSGHQVLLIHSKNELEKGDIAFFLSCFEIIPKEYLKMNKHNIVVHASDLPKGKGWSPMSWQIIEGKNTIPLTLFEADEKTDSGDWYIKDNLDLNGTELCNEWQSKLGYKIIDMSLDFVKNSKTIKAHKQKGEETFYKRRTPKDSELDINKTIKEQFNLLRTADNEKYPAFFEYACHKYIIRITKEENTSKNPVGGGKNVIKFFIAEAA